MTTIITSAVTLTAALAIHALVRNRAPRGKLRFAMLSAGAALLLSLALAVPRVAPTIPAELHALPGLLLALAVIATLVATLLNPWQADRPSHRFPTIVQDALIVLLFFLAATFVFRDSGIVAASAVSAVVVGFALQDTLGNAFAGLAIQIEKPFRPGNWIRVSGYEGTVEEITWRATKIRTRNGTFVVVPNSVISKEPIVNYNEPIAPVRLAVDVGATYAKPPTVVKAAMLEAVRQAPLSLASPAPVVHLVEFGNSAILYRAQFWIADFEHESTALDQVRTAVYYSFARHGIEIPYPIQVEYSRDEAPTGPTPAELGVTLGGVEMFAAFGAEERERLVAGAWPRTFGAGEVIVRQGDEGHSLFVVHTGSVRVTVEPGDHEVARLGAGAVFGEMSLLTGEPRTATASAAEDATLIEVDADTVRGLVLANPSVVDAMSLIVVARRAGLDAARTAALEDAGLRAESTSLVSRVTQFLRL